MSRLNSRATDSGGSLSARPDSSNPTEISPTSRPILTGRRIAELPPPPGGLGRSFLDACRRLSQVTLRGSRSQGPFVIAYFQPGPAACSEQGPRLETLVSGHAAAAVPALPAEVSRSDSLVSWKVRSAP